MKKLLFFLLLFASCREIPKQENEYYDALERKKNGTEEAYLKVQLLRNEFTNAIIEAKSKELLGGEDTVYINRFTTLLDINKDTAGARNYIDDLWKAIKENKKLSTIKTSR